MNPRLLATLAAAGTVLAVLGYSYLDYDTHTRTREIYSNVAGADPAFEPFIVEPLLEPPPFVDYYGTFGYESAEYHPSDGSVTLTYGGDMGTHRQTYQVNQTFVYMCLDFEESTSLRFYQYRGTNTFQGALSLVLVHFEIDVPEVLPCTFPNYLEHTVDIYDAGRLDRYDLRPYEPGGGEAADVEAVRHAVIYSPIFIDPLPVKLLDDESFRHLYWITDMTRNPDDSITIIHGDAEGATYELTYRPGQTYPIGCTEYEDRTSLHFYNYRGPEVLWGGENESLVLVNFEAYTRVPIPCTFPDYLDYVDVFDTGRFDLRYDMEWYKEEVTW